MTSSGLAIVLALIVTVMAAGILFYAFMLVDVEAIILTHSGATGAKILTFVMILLYLASLGGVFMGVYKLATKDNKKRYDMPMSPSRQYMTNAA